MSNTSKDPVCGMNVEQNKTQHKAEHEGKKYAFCSKQCLDKFKHNPGQFAK